MADSRWIDLPRGLLLELSRELRGLRGNERLAVAGVATVLVSFFLPWYGFPVGGDPLAQTGFGAFSFAEGALLAICAAVVFLALQVGGGYIPPRPLTEWGLFVAAGIWAAMIVGYRMLDRPDLELRIEPVTFESTYRLRYGIFVALGGALLIVVAGLRARRQQLAPGSRGRDHVQVTGAGRGRS